MAIIILGLLEDTQCNSIAMHAEGCSHLPKVTEHVWHTCRGHVVTLTSRALCSDFCKSFSLLKLLLLLFRLDLEQISWVCAFYPWYTPAALWVLFILWVATTLSCAIIMFLIHSRQTWLFTCIYGHVNWSPTITEVMCSEYVSSIHRLKNNILLHST